VERGPGRHSDEAKLDAGIVRCLCACSIVQSSRQRRHLRTAASPAAATQPGVGAHPIGHVRQGVRGAKSVRGTFDDFGLTFDNTGKNGHYREFAWSGRERSDPGGRLGEVLLPGPAGGQVERPLAGVRGRAAGEGEQPRSERAWASETTRSSSNTTCTPSSPTGPSSCTIKLTS
jgi:hypothetical protein